MKTYDIQYTAKFKRELRRAKKQHKDMNALFDVVDMLSKGETLDEKYHDHALSGKYKGVRECHIEPDWLLVYEKIEDTLVLLLSRLGTHAELFQK